MSEGHGDIHSIRNMMIFFVVLTVIGLVLSIGTIVYGIVKEQLAKAEAEEDIPQTPPPTAPTIGASLRL